MKTQKSIRKQINWAALSRIHGLLLLILACFMAVPGVYAFIGEETDWQAFAYSSAISTVAGLLLLRFGRNHRKTALGKREGFLLTSTVWIVLSFVGMLPFVFGSPNLNITDAFFESMSGFTTTGATTILSIDTLPDSIHLWRCIMEWMGGMGIIIFTIALLPMLNSSGGLQMFNAEATGVTHDKIAPRVSQTAKRLWMLYILLTAIAATLLALGPMNVFESICHALTTLSTGGISTSSHSLAYWHSDYVNIVILIFMFLGGVNFVNIYRIATGRLRSVWKDEILRVYVKTIVLFSLILIVIGFFNSNHEISTSTFLDPVFDTVSTITSTGFQIGEIQRWSSAVFPIIIMLMIIGGCAGSTSGGAKIDRFLYLFKNCKNQIRRVVHPNRYYPLTVNNRPGGYEAMNKVTAFLALYFGIIVAGALILNIMGLPTADSFLATISSISNSASFGIGTISDSYSSVPDAGKWLLSFIMMIGRLEIFTVLVLFTTTFWKKG